MLRKIYLPPWLLITLACTFLMRIPSFLEPFYYGDEMIYLVLGQGIRRGLILYKDIHDNKPPFLYFLAAISGNMFWFRVILAVWMIATIILFWYFAKSLFKSPKTSTVATIIFAVLTSLPLFEGTVANAELFMLLPTIAACFIAWKGKSIRSAFIAGILLSLASLFKIPSVFDVGAVVSIWLFSLKFNKRSFLSFVKETFFLILGLCIPIGLTFVWYYLRGAFHEYLVAAFLQNFGYVSSWRGAASVQVPFLVKNGPLLIRGGLVIVSFLVLFFFRNKRSKVFLFACAWAVTSLFAATLSERPYPHYLVQVLPSISLFFAFLFTDETMEHVLVVFPLTAIFLTAVYFQFWYYPTSVYFTRFKTLVTESKTQYFDSFSPVVNRNYELAQTITGMTGPRDRIFIWGDSAGIYALSNRTPAIKYVADYHIRDFSSEEETVSLLEANPPKLLVFLSEAPTSVALMKFARSEYIQLQSISGTSIWYNTSQ